MKLHKLLLPLVVLIAVPAYAGNKVVCKDAAGNHSIRSKCKKPLARVTVQDLISQISANTLSITSKGAQGDMGPQGPAGPAGAAGIQGVAGVAGLKGSLDLENCRQVETFGSNLFDLSDSVVTAIAQCDINSEYLLDYGYKLQYTNSTTFAVPTVDKISSNKIPYRIDVSAVRIPPSQSTARVDLFARAVCCKRN